jgi:tetratricopeptide (TPR) repeat protein
MQVTALQFARGGEEHDGLKLWSAQTALWQLKYIDAESIQDDKTRQRLQMLPRLAESISQKYSQSSVEATLLHVSVLQQQEKYTEILETLNNINDDSLLTTQQKCELVAMAYEKQKEWESAQLVYQKLLQEHPAQWMYWKRLLENAFRQDGIKYASETIHTLLNIIKDESNKYPVRAHHLILCELAAVQIRGLDNGEDDSVIVEDDTETLQRAIVDYGNTFGPRASCAYSDLAKYIELLATKNASSHETLLEWASRMLVENQSAADRSMLRSYVFAIQVIYKVVTMSKDEKAIEKWLPAWEDLVVVWRNSQKMGTATAGDDVREIDRVEARISYCLLTMPSLTLLMKRYKKRINLGMNSFCLLFKTSCFATTTRFASCSRRRFCWRKPYSTLLTMHTLRLLVLTCTLD